MRISFAAVTLVLVSTLLAGCPSSTGGGTPCNSDTDCPTGSYCAAAGVGCTSDCRADADCLAHGGGACDVRGHCGGAHRDGGIGGDGGGTDGAVRDGGVRDGATGDVSTSMCATDPDHDHDGQNAVACGGTDCDDGNASVRFGANEICDATMPASMTLDENCDDSDNGVQTAPALSVDADSDHFASNACCNGTRCGPDCNDSNDMIHPGATEICDGVDNNCDGTADEGVTETVYVDCDGDGWGESGAGVAGCHGSALPASLGCSTGGQYVRGRMLSSSGALAFDCSGTDATINPMAADGCPTLDGIDNDCDGSMDEAGTETVYPDCDHDTWPSGAGSIVGCHGTPLPASMGCVSGATWLRAGSTPDCNDSPTPTGASVFPTQTEICNGVDDNCNGATDEGLRSNLYDDSGDNDGYGVGGLVNVCNGTPGYAANGGDCAPTNPSIHPGASESCNNLDDNCNGTIDEGLRSTLYYDGDNDGWGAGAATSVCTGTPRYVANNSDCDDSRSDRWHVVDNLRQDADGDGHCVGGLYSSCVGAGGGSGGYIAGFLSFPAVESFYCVAPDDCADLNNAIPGRGNGNDDCSYYYVYSSFNGCGCPGSCGPDYDLTCPTGWRPGTVPGYDRCFQSHTGGGNCSPSENWTSGATRSCHLTQTCNFLEGTNCQAYIACEPCTVSSCAF